MTSRPREPATVAVVLALIAVGVTTALLAIAAREDDPRLLSDQRHPPTLTESAVARALASTREPLRGGRGTRARSARCRAGHQNGPLRNPWSCRVVYRSGRTVRYDVRVLPTGRLYGVDAARTAVVQGRVPVPGA